jgi:hypothetical protein
MVVNSEKTIITLAENTENHLTDGEAYILEDIDSDEPNAAIFSKSDLTINGSGSLIVKANYNNGIQSKDDLKITEGNINVCAKNDGINVAGGIDRSSINGRPGQNSFTISSNNHLDITGGYICRC